MKIRIITASAGSGKTWRLTKELDDAIASGAARPEGIIATTFTKQAAAELIERARTRLLQGGRGREAHQLLAARIGTVNSVCGSLVADFAFELGLSPDLRVLDEPTSELEFKRALARVVTSELADELGALTSHFDRDLDWRHEVRRIVEAARANGLSPAQLATCADHSIRDLDACMGPVLSSDLDAELRAVLLSTIAAITGNEDKTKGTAEYVELLHSCVRDLDGHRLKWGEWAKLTSSTPKKKSLEVAAVVNEVAALHLAHPRLRAEMHALIRTLFRVAADGLSAYQQYKREGGVIDFVDQETLALEVLRIPEVREALAGQIDLVLVDEFQDTSPIQLAVFLELAAIAKESIWVGDPKQAIYGFRGTDPGLMDAAIESLTSTKTDADLVEQAARAVARGTVDTLDVSYRSRPELVAITSEIFARAFATQGMPEERTRLRPNLVHEPEGLGTVLEYWPLDLEKSTNEARAQAVAAGVRDLFTRDVKVRGDEGVRSARRSDVAVLCRTNAQCQLVADELGHLGVAAVVPRMALLDTTEAMVLLSALQLWADPGDALAAAEIARVVTHPRDLEAFVTRALETPGSEAFASDPTVARILAARQGCRDLDPMSVFDLLLEASALRALCAGWGDAAQRLANLDALRSHALSYVDEATARGDAPTLVGLIEQLTELGSEGWDKSRADRQALLSEGESVTVSTWHRAKGLEWPVTVLFGLETLREPQSHGVHVMSERSVFEVDDPLGGRWIRFWPNPYTNQQQKGPVRTAFEQSPAHAALVARAEREALRVLYVGWTRAKDRLILAAERNRLLAGIVGTLAKINPVLIIEPTAEVRGLQAIEWAGLCTTIETAPVAPAPAVVATPVAGAVTTRQGAMLHEQARSSPSAIDPVPCSVGEVVTLGPHISVAGRPDMETVGHAVHAFFGADRPGMTARERLEMADEILKRFELGGALQSSDVVAAADRFNAWLETRFRGARVHRELPILQQLTGGTIVGGTADLVLVFGDRSVVVDHKSFPGLASNAAERARTYSGQIATYANAIRASLGGGVSTWIHYPVVGIAVEILLDGVEDNLGLPSVVAAQQDASTAVEPERPPPAVLISDPSSEVGEPAPVELQQGSRVERESRSVYALHELAVAKNVNSMITLEVLTKGMSLVGIEPTLVVTLVAVVPIGDGAVQAIYKTSDGTLKERLLTRADEASISVATEERPWAFDGNGEDFKLAVEAKRIDLAFLFDPMMAVHTSNVDPLPHQITAVYDAMLPRQPLRFVLADDPGAGKTIMAGLYIRELLMRADARRVLIVAPGSLVEQWRDELFEKFGLEFRVFSKELEAASPSGNPFDDHEHLIVRLDQMARSEDLQEKLCAAGWDLIVFDEAHKLSAHFYGTKIEKTGRFQLAERLGRHTRHLLLMTATPHNGKEEDFQLFLSLLDSDRFYGKFRDGVHKVDCSDLMRRMVKEQMVKFDGTPLFPERKAYTVNYKLSDIEAPLYEAVTQYVRTEMGKADQLEGARKGSVGFALTALQRRLASSPEAIYQSLKRRKERLEKRVRDEKLGVRGSQILAETVAAIPDDDDDLDATEEEDLEETLVDQATTAHTIAELEQEIVLLRGLELQAKAVVVSGQDRKWEELSQILQHNPAMHDAGGRQSKLIIFSEHRDTLNYLQAKIAGVLGNADAIVTIHGGTHRDERRRLQAIFRSDPEVRILIATDAAGEGVNLQNANLMVNYDLPWNPNRLEQRFGRIHRIGQQEVCHLWNLVANETREGAVFFRLLEKLRVESEALKGRVFDILGDVFEGVRLKDLLVEAIRYGHRDDVRARLRQQVEHAFDHDHLRTILERNALAQESMSAERLFAVKEEMERAEARRLQPYFVRSFFTKAFASLGGSMHPREADRFEVTHVPSTIRERDRLITGRNRRELAPVLKRYERVCFTREAVRPIDKPNAPFAAMLHPGHPLMLAVSDLLLEQHGNLLRQGTILVDPTDEGDEAHLLFLLTHEIKSGHGQVLSKRLQFVRVSADGSPTFAGWAPHLDLEALPSTDRGHLAGLLAAPWIRADQEQRALALAAASLVPEHFKEVAERRIAHVDKTLTAVHERLTKEIAFLSDRWMKLKEDQALGKDVRLNLENARRTVSDLEGRLENRKKELQAMRHVTSGTPVALGGALVVPIGLLRRLRGEPPADDAPTFSADAEARRRIELLAMAAVRKAEEARRCRVVDVSAQKCGWDLTSYPPAVDGNMPEPRHIEVKGRVQGATTVTVTANEIFYAFNQAEKFFLAIVLVGEGDVIDGPHYIQNPFGSEAGWGVASVNYELKTLLAKAARAQ